MDQFVNIPDYSAGILMPWGGIAFVTLILTEIFFSLKYDKELYQWKDFAASTSMGLGATILSFASKAWAFFLFYLVYEIFNYWDPATGWYRSILGYGSFGFEWYMFLICQFFDDFNYYWHHRLSHEVRVLWAAHIVHHSSDNYNLGTAIRNGWVTLFYKPVFWLWLPAIGFHPIMVMTCFAIQSLWQFQLHSKFIPHLGFLEKFINTHRQHQVHHSQNIDYLDKNHGGYLNIFDKLFGTHKELDPSQETKFGVLHPPQSYNPLVIVSHEYRDIWKDVQSTKNWKHKMMYIFGPPGWSPDGSRQTVKEMQADRESGKRKSPYGEMVHA